MRSATVPQRLSSLSKKRNDSPQFSISSTSLGDGDACNLRQIEDIKLKSFGCDMAKPIFSQPGQCQQLNTIRVSPIDRVFGVGTRRDEDAVLMRYPNMGQLADEFIDFSYANFVPSYYIQSPVWLFCLSPDWTEAGQCLDHVFSCLLMAVAQHLRSTVKRGDLYIRAIVSSSSRPFSVFCLAFAEVRFFGDCFFLVTRPIFLFIIDSSPHRESISSATPDATVYHIRNRGLTLKCFIAFRRFLRAASVSLRRGSPSLDSGYPESSTLCFHKIHLTTVPP